MSGTDHRPQYPTIVPLGNQGYTNSFTDRYNLMHEAKPMEVIHHLYSRMCARQLPLDYTHEPFNGIRSWAGGPKSRVPQQKVSSMDPPLELQHVLEVFEWLFTEMQIVQDMRLPSDLPRLNDRDQPCYLNRLQCVNAQPIAAGFKNTKHRPYDMLAAIFLCADFMPATNEQKHKLAAYKHTFMQMYLEQSTHFDYMHKDVYAHNYNRALHSVD